MRCQWQFLRIPKILLKYKNVLKSPKIPVWANGRLWKDFVLPSLPIFLGILGGLTLKHYPYPNIINNSTGRFIFGIVAGFLSGFVYKMVKAQIKSKTPMLGTPDNSNNSDSTPDSDH